MYLILSNERACMTCRRYYKGKKLTKDLLSGKGLHQAFESAELQPPDIADNTHALIGKSAFRGFHLVGDTCPSCKDNILRVMVHYGKIMMLSLQASGAAENNSLSLKSPHGGSWRDFLASSPDQMRASWASGEAPDNQGAVREGAHSRSGRVGAVQH
jgi:hypothetical protein